MQTTKMISDDLFKQSMFHHYFAAAPIGFIDVGARGGSHSLVEPLHTHVSFLGFEPDQEECDQLNADETLKKYWNQFRVLPHALGNTHEKRVLNILSSPTNSSLLEPNNLFIDRYNMSAKWTVTKSIDVNVVPLDYVMYDLKLGFPHSGEIIKLDTQGTEYEILQGAQKLLADQTVCVVTEVEFFPVYKNQKLFSDVELYLREQGFSFYGFLTQHTRSKKSLNKKTNWGRERLFYADAVFFKDPFFHAKSLNERQLNVLLFSAILTGFYDFAHEIAASKLLNLAKKDIQVIADMVNAISYVNPHYTEEQLSSLVKKVEKDKENVNVLLGKFVETMNLPDFEDCRLDSF